MGNRNDMWRILEDVFLQKDMINQNVDNYPKLGQNILSYDAKKKKNIERAFFPHRLT